MPSVSGGRNVSTISFELVESLRHCFGRAAFFGRAERLCCAACYTYGDRHSYLDRDYSADRGAIGHTDATCAHGNTYRGAADTDAISYTGAHGDARAIGSI
jgi:hypothetical protein